MLLLLLVLILDLHRFHLLEHVLLGVVGNPRHLLTASKGSLRVVAAASHVLYKK